MTLELDLNASPTKEISSLLARTEHREAMLADRKQTKQGKNERHLMSVLSLKPNVRQSNSERTDEKNSFD
jgi:hypothetical protein